MLFQAGFFQEVKEVLTTKEFMIYKHFFNDFNCSTNRACFRISCGNY